MGEPHTDLGTFVQAERWLIGPRLQEDDDWWPGGVGRKSTRQEEWQPAYPGQLQVPRAKYMQAWPGWSGTVWLHRMGGDGSMGTSQSSVTVWIIPGGAANRNIPTSGYTHISTPGCEYFLPPINPTPMLDVYTRDNVKYLLDLSWISDDAQRQKSFDATWTIPRWTGKSHLGKILCKRKAARKFKGNYFTPRRLWIWPAVPLLQCASLNLVLLWQLYRTRFSPRYTHEHCRIFNPSSQQCQANSCSRESSSLLPRLWGNACGRSPSPRFCRGWGKKQGFRTLI